MLNKLLKRKKPEQTTIHTNEIDSGSIPEHVAIIMDGNGRWAKKRNLPRVSGHHEGMQTAKKIVSAANELGVKVLTLYAFSTENWKRPKKEVDYLMKLPEEFLNIFLPELVEQNVQVRNMGLKDDLPEHTRRAVDKAVEQTKENDGMILNFALNYGSRNEIVEAAKKMAEDLQSGKFGREDIDEELFENYLLTNDLKDPDLLIRTSGEIRLSNFMLWQLAYTEFWFTDVLWPDFTGEHLVDAIKEYQRRTRRYGGV